MSTYDGPRRPVHACSLSISVIKRINDQLEEEKNNGDPDTLRRLKWLEVAMVYNRQLQLKYIYETLGNKGNAPEFRAVRMSQFWHQWKRESLRSDWAILRQCVDRRMATREINDKSNFLESQRIELAARHFLGLDKVKKMPTDEIINIKPLEPVYSFVTPKAILPGFYNQVVDLAESTQVTTMSRDIEGISTTTTSTMDSDDDGKTLAERFKELAAERGFVDDENQFETLSTTATTESESEVQKRDVKERNIYIVGDNDEIIEIQDEAPVKKNIDEKGRRTAPKAPPPVPVKPNYNSYFVIVALVLLVAFVSGIKQINWKEIIEKIKQATKKL